MYTLVRAKYQVHMKIKTIKQLYRAVIFNLTGVQIRKQNITGVHLSKENITGVQNGNHNTTQQVQLFS